MYLYKQITIRFDLSKVYDGSDSEKEYLLKQLKAKYEKICAFDSYVDEIIAITGNTLCTSNPYDLHGSFQVDISFTARVIVYRPGELLTNVKIIKKNEQIYGIIDGHTNVIIAKSQINDGLEKEKDLLVPILVDEVFYPDNQKMANVVGSFTPRPAKPECAYLITNELTEQETIILDEMVALIKAIEIPKTEKANYYQKILYPFKTMKPMPKTQSINFLEKKEWSDLSGKRVIYPRETPRDVTICNIDEGKEKAIEASAFNVLNIYLGMHYSHLLLLYNLCTQYPDIKDLSNVVKVILAGYHLTKTND